VVKFIPHRHIFGCWTHKKLIKKKDNKKKDNKKKTIRKKGPSRNFSKIYFEQNFF